MITGRASLYEGAVDNKTVYSVAGTLMDWREGFLTLYSKETVIAAVA